MKKVWLIIFLLIIGRIWVATNTKHGDLHNGWFWAGVAYHQGWSGFFDLPRDVFWPQSRPNQPAGSIYLYTWSYWFNISADHFFKWANHTLPVFPSPVVWWWERWGDVVSLKLPSIAGDLAIFAAIIYWGKKLNKQKLATSVGLVYLINPALWYNSSLWGQNDCIVAALAIWSLILLFEKKLFWSAALLGFSVATKASWAPLGWLYAIYWWKKFPKQMAGILVVPLAGLAAFWSFHPHLDLPIWLSQLFLQRILPGESAFVSVNAFNLWQLIFGPAQLQDSAYGANLMGIVISASLAIWTGIRLWKKPTEQNLLYLMLILYFGLFLFATRMHERYMYPLFPLMSLLIVGGYKIWKQYLILSVTYLINLYSQWYAPTMPAVIALYTVNFTRVISAVNLGVWSWLVSLKPSKS